MCVHQPTSPMCAVECSRCFCFWRPSAGLHSISIHLVIRMLVVPFLTKVDPSRAALAMIGCRLQRVLNNNDTQATTVFDSVAIPGVDLSSYVGRICQFARCTSDVLVVALIFLDRITNSGLVLLTARNVHRLVLLSILTANKCLEDIRMSNAEYAIVGNVPVEDLFRLEVLYLFFIRFELFVKADEFASFREKLMGFASSFLVLTTPKYVTATIMGCRAQGVRSGRRNRKSPPSRYAHVSSGAI
jgi:hypothetical protein